MLPFSFGDLVLLDPDVSYMVDLVGRGDPSPKREREQGDESPREKQRRVGSSEDQSGSFGSRDVQRGQEERRRLNKEAKVEFERIVKIIISQSSKFNIAPIDPHCHQINYHVLQMD